MTYTVDVKGNLKIIKDPPDKLLTDWENFKIHQNDNGTVHVELHNRTPYYPDVVAKLHVLSQFYKGKLEGKGEDGEPYSIILPVSREDIISASERKRWKPNFCLYQKEFLDTDRFFHELKKIGFEEFYPEWLKTQTKGWFIE